MGMAAFFGLALCAMGMYLQINYSSSPNSTLSLLHKAKLFVNSDEEHKWESLRVNALYGVQRVSEMVAQSMAFIYNQFNQQMAAKNAQRNEL